MKNKKKRNQNRINNKAKKKSKKVDLKGKRTDGTELLNLKLNLKGLIWFKHGT